ncbi:hypothetical protein Goklo_024411 [Gossypium klotzschianum]|uniref:Myb/SANT-like domain-containing protein n=1 Tax=Gossypium klotzschianum TaxID=34286 RepID=A0A7J8WED9_9ROSI|nr:hypothetical protein [Gossypium klotzschianum]
MLSGKDNSDLGWDEHRQLIVAKDVVWNSYINMNLSATQSQPLRNQDDSTFSKKKKKRFLMQVNKFLLLYLLMLPRYWGKTYELLDLK